MELSLCFCFWWWLLVFTEWPWHALSQVTAVSVLLRILYHHYIWCQRQCNAFDDTLPISTCIDYLFFHIIAWCIRAIYWCINTYAQRFLLMHISKLFVCGLEFSLNTETFHALFSDKLWCFSDQRKFTPQQSHRQESFNEMFMNVWGLFCLFVNVWVWRES